MSLSPTNGISKLSVDDVHPSGSVPPSDPSDDPTAGAAAGDGIGQPPAAAAETTSAEEATSDADADATSQNKVRTICGVCKKEVSKYKCPHCALAYCSVSCSRVHRDEHPPESLLPRPAPAPTASAGLPVKPDTARHPFSVLDDSPELKRLFAKYPNLPAALSRIHAATLPPPGKEGTRGGLPWSLADVKDKLQAASGASGRRQEPWSQDVGLRRGKNALRKARMDPGEDGDGVREYCELVLHLLSTAVDGQGSNHITSVVKREALQEEVRVIERLQKEEHADRD